MGVAESKRGGKGESLRSVSLVVAGKSLPLFWANTHAYLIRVATDCEWRNRNGKEPQRDIESET